MQSVDLAKVIGLAWDCGAVTTGPVTVPLVLALGIGIASAAGSGDNSMSGFGIVTLASLFPILGVLGLAFYVHFTYPIDMILAMAEGMQSSTPAWYEQTPFAEAVAGIRAIVPLVLFLAVVLFAVLKEKLPNAKIVLLGFSLIGMMVFNLGKC